MAAKNWEIKWFEKDSDAELVRETIERLAVWEDPDRWLERLRLVRLAAQNERKMALDAKRNPV